jgi:hypothetical protein
VKYPIGSERLRKKPKTTYIEVKVSETEWRLKHLMAWEAANGRPVPDGHVVCFVDGDTRNFSPENLKAVPRREHLENEKRRRNQQPGGSTHRSKYPIGAERLQLGYVEVKVSSSEWRRKHHLVWEAAHGPVPDGHHICFIDGDTRNFDLDNLIVSSRAEIPIGTERMNGDYIQVKVAEPNSWRSKHHLVWEEANGPLPDGHRLIFADGNPQNIALDNLVLMSISVWGYLATKGHFKAFTSAEEPELFKAAANLAKLDMAIKKKLKENKS